MAVSPKIRRRRYVHTVRSETRLERVTHVRELTTTPASAAIHASTTKLATAPPSTHGGVNHHATPGFQRRWSRATDSCTYIYPNRLYVYILYYIILYYGRVPSPSPPTDLTDQIP